MNVKLLLVALSLFVTGIFAIATASIGIECYNDEANKAFKEKKKDNMNFMITVLVSAIVMVIVAAGSIYLAAQMPNV